MKNVIEMLEKRKKDIEEDIRYNQESIISSDHYKTIALALIEVSQKSLDEIHTAIEILKGHFEDDI